MEKFQYYADFLSAVFYFGVMDFKPGQTSMVMYTVDRFILSIMLTTCLQCQGQLKHLFNDYKDIMLNQGSGRGLMHLHLD